MHHVLRLIQSPKIYRSVCLSLVLLLCLAGQAHAGESFTATLSLYQGFDLASGMTEVDPTVLTLLFGDTEQAEIVLATEENPFEFSPSVDFYFGFESGATNSLLFVPEDNIVGMAVLSEMPTGDVSALLTAPSSTAFAPGDILAFHTLDGQYFIISDLAALSAATLTMQVTEYSEYNSAVPEPSTLLLVVGGLLAVVGIARRTGKIRRKRASL